MSRRRHSKPALVVSLPRLRRRVRAWMWAAIAAIAGVLVFALVTSRSPPPVADTPGLDRFLPTVENKTPPPGPAPEGMVWIPGGEFSMGARDPLDMNDMVGMRQTTDARPVHRVFVDGFWMDATEVTNEQFGRFVKSTGYVTIAEQTPARRGFPRRAARKPGAGVSRVYSARSCRVAERFVSMVVRSRRGQLAPSAGSLEFD